MTFPCSLIFFFSPFFKRFTELWLCWVFGAAPRLSLIAVSQGYSSLQCVGCSLQWFLLLQSTSSGHLGFISCVPRYVETSWTRDQIQAPCVGRQILYHWATREALLYFFCIVWLLYNKDVIVLHQIKTNYRRLFFRASPQSACLYNWGLCVYPNIQTYSYTVKQCLGSWYRKTGTHTVACF